MQFLLKTLTYIQDGSKIRNMIDPLLHNNRNFSDTLKNLTAFASKTFKVCPTILKHYALKG